MGVDLNKVGGEYLPEGIHIVTIASVDRKKINTGNECIELHVEDEKGRKCKTQGIFITKNNGQEESWGFMLQFLRKSGIFDKLTEAQRADFSPHMLKGHRFCALVTSEETDKGTFSRIDLPTDGVLSRDEYTDHKEGKLAMPPKPAPAPVKREPAPSERTYYADEPTMHPNMGGEDDLPF